MVFCNPEAIKGHCNVQKVTILILVDGFLQYCKTELYLDEEIVTILILVDGFLQFI